MQHQDEHPETPTTVPSTEDNKTHIPPQAPASPAPSPPTSSTPVSRPPSPKPAAPCTVCGVDKSKYKCPRCYRPYCSVACNKIHKENHPPDEPKPVPRPAEPASSGNGPPPVSDSHHGSSPFRALDSSDHLQHLFRKYPRLAEQLRRIYAAMQPPDDAPDGRIPASLMQGVAKKDQWNHDIGIKRGKEALRKARKLKGEAGDAIREYSELVLHLIHTHDEEGQAAAVLQQQVAQQDSKLIEQLLAQERG